MEFMQLSVTYEASLTGANSTIYNDDAGMGSSLIDNDEDTKTT